MTDIAGLRARIAEEMRALINDTLVEEMAEAQVIATYRLAEAVLCLADLATPKPFISLPPTPDNWDVTAKGRAVWTGPLDADGHPMPEEGL